MGRFVFGALCDFTKGENLVIFWHFLRKRAECWSFLVTRTFTKIDVNIWLENQDKEEFGMTVPLKFQRLEQKSVWNT